MTPATSHPTHPLPSGSGAGTETPASEAAWSEALPANVENKILRASDGCWLWTGCLTVRGYGHLSQRGRVYRAHRFIYDLLVGPIPPGLALDHLCRVRSCVNPEHLEPVTSGENTRRGLTGINNAIKTHCPIGHEYTPENTYVRTYTHNERTHRICRTCHRTNSAAYRAARARA